MCQAAQNLQSHPGPLGHFFRKLCRKKNRNVAIVATARKLVTIAFHMLKNSEPYRYAVPEGTQRKLFELERLATGKRRRQRAIVPRSERAPGTKARNTRSLPEIYQITNLPAAKSLEELLKGERRMLAVKGAEKFVKEIQDPQQKIVRRKAAAA